MESPQSRTDTMLPSRALGLFFVVVVAFMIVQPLAMQLPLLPQVAIIASQLLVILGGAMIYRAKFARSKLRWPRLNSPGMSIWALGFVLAASVSLGFLANALGALTVYVFPGLAPMAEAYQTQIETLLLPEAVEAQILGAIAVALVAPVAEEVLFRGTILPEQRRDQLAYSAILLNGILFSFMHLNPVAFISLAVVGCYFAHITVRSGSLWGAVLGHAALNLVNGVILVRLIDEVPDPAEVELLELGVALGVLIPVTALLWWFSIRLIRNSDRADELVEPDPGPEQQEQRDTDDEREFRW